MDNLIIQQRDLDIIRQTQIIIYSKVELLNHNFKIIDSVEGVLITDSFNIDAESDIRRTYSCELFVKDSSFSIGKDKKIWIDKYIRPYIGIKYQRTGEIIWYLQGTFLFNDVDTNNSDTNLSMSLKCSDMMCTLNGDMGGYIEGFTLTIPEGSEARDTLIALFSDAGITKYKIIDVDFKIPYDMKYSVGITYHKVLKDIVDLYAGYEVFFDLFGTLVIQKIPSTAGENPILDETIINPLVITESIGNSFKKIYNKTQIWGGTIEADYYVETSTSTDGISYTASIAEVEEYENFAKYGVKILINNKDNPTLKINNLSSKDIYDDYGNKVTHDMLLADTVYVFKYRLTEDSFLLLGQFQAYGEYTNNDSDCPFSIVNVGYTINQILNFSELPSDALCEQRAKYETWKATRMQDTITLNMILIPFLDVNHKVSYIPTKGIKGDYIIKSINGSNNDFKMNVTMIKYSDLYPDIIPRKR
jgi:hypothetical protein